MAHALALPLPMAMASALRGGIAYLVCMTTLMDPKVREETRARRVELSKGIERPTDGERRARERIKESFEILDGSDAACLALLTGASVDDVRRVGAV